MEIYRLPEKMRPYKCETLVRMGKNYDGGYIVNKNDVIRAQQLLSFGIGLDWSFEKDFNMQNKCPIIAYDGSISLETIIRHFKKTIRRIERPMLILDSYCKIKDYRTFFNGKSIKHIPKFIDIDKSDDSDSLDDVLESISPSKPVFIKMDIEGTEYKLLNKLIHYQKQTVGLTVEFHNLEINIEKILSFIENYDLNLVHTHVNNCGGTFSNNIPNLLELTFSSEPVRKIKVNHLPNKLDMSNSRKLKQRTIEFF